MQHLSVAFPLDKMEVNSADIDRTRSLGTRCRLIQSLAVGAIALQRCNWKRFRVKGNYYTSNLRKCRIVLASLTSAECREDGPNC